MDWKEIMTILLDKGLIALFLVIVGFWINRKLSAYQSGLEHNMQTKILIAQSRLPAFTSLWERTAPASPTRKVGLGDKEREKMSVSLKDWYYEHGNGLYLSEELRELYLEARNSLEISSSEPRSEKIITNQFSRLRTALKNEIGIYGCFK